MAHIHDWTSVFPTALDSDANMPVLSNDSSPGARDGDLARVSHLHALKASMVQLQQLVGSDLIEDGSLRRQLQLLYANQRLDFYVNFSYGDDLNDGLTALTPKQTLAGIAAVIPAIIDAWVVIHATGVSFVAESLAGKYLTANGWLILTGDESYTTLSTGVADIYSVSTIGASLAGWPTDAFAGRWVSIDSGPAAGDMRLIVSNSSDTLYVASDFSSDPGAARFSVVSPATLLSGGLTVYLDGQGWFSMQRFEIGGYGLTVQTTNSTELGALQIFPPSPWGGFYVAECRWLSFMDWVYDADTLDYDSTFQTYVSSLGGADFSDCQLYIPGGYFGPAGGSQSGVWRIVRCTINTVGSAKLVANQVAVHFAYCGKISDYYYGPGTITNLEIKNVDFYARPALTFLASRAILRNNINIHNNTGPGIYLDQSMVGDISDSTALAGATNGSGLFLGNLSTFTANGLQPTLSGGGGDVVTGFSGTTTWVAVFSGTNFIDSIVFSNVLRG